MIATQAPPTYSSADVCRLANITNRQLRFWVERGYLNPQELLRGEPTIFSQRPGAYDFRWSQDEFDRARMMARLVLLGVTAQRAAFVARHPDERHSWLRDVFVACRAMEL